METKQRLSKYREASGISQERAAEKLNVSRQTISRWENGVSIPSTENLAKLSELYNVPVDTLLRDLDEPFFVPEQTVSSKPLAEEPAKPARKKTWSWLAWRSYCGLWLLLACCTFRDEMSRLF